MKNSINDIFGSHVFNDRVMREKLPKNVYLSLKKTIVEGTPLDSTIAEVVACAMKDRQLTSAQRTIVTGSSQ